MKRKAVMAFLFAVTALFLVQCASEENTYKGKKISISFHPTYEYQAGEGFFLEGYPVYHNATVADEIVFRNDSLRIPPRYLVFMPEAGDSPLGREEVGNIHMALALKDAVTLLGKEQGEDEKMFCPSPKYALLKGELILEKHSGKRITLRVPEDYPLVVKILE